MESNSISDWLRSVLPDTNSDLLRELTAKLHKDGFKSLQDFRDLVEKDITDLDLLTKVETRRLMREVKRQFGGTDAQEMTKKRLVGMACMMANETTAGEWAKDKQIPQISSEKLNSEVHTKFGMLSPENNLGLLHSCSISTVMDGDLKGDLLEMENFSELQQQISVARENMKMERQRVDSLITQENQKLKAEIAFQNEELSYERKKANFSIDNATPREPSKEIVFKKQLETRKYRERNLERDRLKLEEAKLEFQDKGRVNKKKLEEQEEYENELKLRNDAELQQLESKLASEREIMLESYESNERNFSIRKLELFLEKKRMEVENNPMSGRRSLRMLATNFIRSFINFTNAWFDIPEI